ncbi:benzoate 1,2-dioxygenase electron transfer component BenC [Nesterenkonia cremea]|uniref:Benzoate 1,2-dioxygenase ferredoxin reductase n=1 Tax=Nesterenkonia cremea TaxID=1882340 RepID=A0A917ERP4_9MICC|nr:benzoate 1,2-dioxygenase electron transfer component BenC [Nesterenkonia cremea]GGE76898.1 benzoate 1,2-dioxygenase ferredoxin reductase [Nesterenkonia cremea]
MSNEVAINFEDGVTKIVRVNPMETIMEAAFKARINLPSDCRDGACGTCKSLCSSGDFDPGDYIEDALSDAELEKGHLLTCQSVPESDMVVEVPTTSEVAKTSAADFEAQITELIHHSETTVSFTMSVKDRDDLAFLPGQYMNLSVPGTDQARSYSFSSGPKEAAASFMVRISPGGAMSDYLTERAAVGDVITMTGPFGSFFLRPPQRRLLLLAGGTGLAPIRSILEKIAQDGTDQPIHLVYGVTRDADVVGLEELDAFSERIETFTYSYCVADPDSSAEQIGYVTQFLDDEHLQNGDVDIYLCGPPPMVDAVSRWLDDEGVQPANFYYEKFAPKGSTDDDETGAPASDEELSASGDSLTAGEAISSMETGQLSFTREDSMAHLDARMGLELAVTELMMGRLSDEQLQQLRRLAEATSELLQDDGITDIEKFATRNEEFHEYLFHICDNPTFFESFRRLDVHNQIVEAMRNGAWIAPEIDAEHFALVEAFESKDLEAARRIIREHNQHARMTMFEVVRG